MSRTEAAVKEIEQIIDDLQTKGEFKLPTEMELVTKLNVGRNTIRAAVKQLVTNGVLEKTQGKGTFICEQKTTLTFSSWSATKTAVSEALSLYINKFTRNYPDYNVDIIKYPHEIYIQRILDLFLRGLSPDVIQITPYWLNEYYKLNIFEPLDSMISPENLQKRYSSDIDTGKIDGRLFALNWALCPLILYYNKNVMRRTGLDPNCPPTTMDELKEMCIHINKSRIDNAKGICLPLQPSDLDHLWFYPFLLAFNGGFVDSIGNITIDTVQNGAALEWLTELIHKGGVTEAKSVPDTRLLFATDQIGFMIDGPYGKGILREISQLGREIDKNYGVALIPVGPSGKSESILISHALAISRFSSQKEAAYRLIESLTTDEETYKYFFERFGVIPCLRDFLHKPYYLQDPFASVVLQQLETAFLAPIQHELISRMLPSTLQVISSLLLKKEKVYERLVFLKGMVEMFKESNTVVLSV